MNAVTKNAAAVLCAATIPLCLAFSASAQTSVQTGPQPAQVMSDTPEYCVILRDKIDQMPADAPVPVVAEVRSLESEGRRLCDAGETRGGILRLRHALMLMMHASREADTDR